MPDIPRNKKVLEPEEQTKKSPLQAAKTPPELQPSVTPSNLKRAAYAFKTANARLAARRRRRWLIFGGAAIFLVAQAVAAYFIVTSKKPTEQPTAKPPGVTGKVEGTDSLALYRRVKTLVDRGKYAEAQEALDRLLLVTKDDDVLNLASALQRRIRAETSGTAPGTAPALPAEVSLELTTHPSGLALVDERGAALGQTPLTVKVKPQQVPFRVQAKVADRTSELVVVLQQIDPGQTQGRVHLDFSTWLKRPRGKQHRVAVSKKKPAPPIVVVPVAIQPPPPQPKAVPKAVPKIAPVDQPPIKAVEDDKPVVPAVE